MPPKPGLMSIFNRRMNEIAAAIDAKSVKHGDPRGLILLMPYMFLVSLVEYLWIRSKRKR